jgi:hypothetical protein
MISRDTYDSVIASLDKDMNTREIGAIDPNMLPFSQNKFAKYLEDQPLGKKI